MRTQTSVDVNISTAWVEEAEKPDRREAVRGSPETPGIKKELASLCESPSAVKPLAEVPLSGDWHKNHIKA